MDHGFRQRDYKEQHGLENRWAIPCTWNHTYYVRFRSKRSWTYHSLSYGMMNYGGNHQQLIQQSQ